MFKLIILIIIGFILLLKGANYLVDASSNIAKKFNVPEIIIGVTIVAIGTSLPELFLSVSSALEGYSDMAVGNVVGSNISNLLLILGISVAINPIYLNRDTLLIEIPICFAITLIFMSICNIKQKVTRIDAIILLVLFILFVIFTIYMTFKKEQFKDKNAENKSDKKNIFKDILYIIVGIIALKLGGDLAINNISQIGKLFNLSEKIVGLALLSFGTSLPELITSISAAIKKKSEIAIGNVLGSNIINMLLVIGTTAFVKPINYNTTYNIDMCFLIIVIVILLLFPLIPPKNKISRSNGISYLFLYVGYIIFLFI